MPYGINYQVTKNMEAMNIQFMKTNFDSYIIPISELKPGYLEVDECVV